jgi:peptidoglycan/xylan/chitin deacetylase (PgdA/CDA1 family)
LRDCKKTNLFRALILPLRTNFLLKLFGIIFVSLILASFSSASSLIFLLLSYTIWNTILWKREKELHNPLNTSSFDDKLIQIKNAITSKDVIVMLPLVKFCMDSGREVGKSIAFFRYLNRRIFSKPIVLTFHHLNDRSQGIESANSKYYCSKEDFEQILEESEQEGRVNVSLSELINRLKNQPRTLYFEKIFAVTFDDGSLSNYGILKDLISKNGYPFTIFVPTCCAGNTNKWDTEKGHRQETIMNWQQMRTLNNMGVEIGSHSCNHVNLAESPRTIKREEVLGSLEDLNSNLSSDLRNGVIFSYPYGAYDQETIEMVKEAGYIGAVANYQGNIRPKTDPWQMPRYTVYSDSDWRSISRQSRAMWFKELIKDVRDWITGFGNN